MNISAAQDTPFHPHLFHARRRECGSAGGEPSQPRGPRQELHAEDLHELDEGEHGGAQQQAERAPDVAEEGDGAVGDVFGHLVVGEVLRERERGERNRRGRKRGEREVGKINTFLYLALPRKGKMQHKN